MTDMDTIENEIEGIAAVGIWALFSVDNEYNQPSNNLVAWWFEKPSFELLAKVIGIDFQGEENILNTVYIHQGQERRIDGSDYRLEWILQGEVK